MISKIAYYVLLSFPVRRPPPFLLLFRVVLLYMSSPADHAVHDLSEPVSLGCCSNANMTEMPLYDKPVVPLLRRM